MNRTDLAYRRTAVEGASGIGLLIALYDTLAGDLRRAAEAQRAGHIEGRCKEVKHATVVIGYLEDCLYRSPGGALTQQLAAFYSSLRRKLIEAQAKQSPEILDQQMALILKIREYWQQLDLRAPEPQPNGHLAIEGIQTAGYLSSQAESRYGGWSV